MTSHETLMDKLKLFICSGKAFIILISYVLFRLYLYVYNWYHFIVVFRLFTVIYVYVYNCSTTVGLVDRYSVVNVHLRVLLYQSLVLRRKWECVIAVTLNSILRLPQGESSPCYTCNTGGYCIHRYLYGIAIQLFSYTTSSQITESEKLHAHMTLASN